MRARTVAVLVAAAALAAPATPAAAAEPRLRLVAPQLRATGVEIPARASGAAPRARVTLEVRREGRWRPVDRDRADRRGTARLRFTPGGDRHRVRLRAVSRRARPSRARTVRARDVTLAAFGDANLGDGVKWVMRDRGATWPWGGVAPTLRGADIAFGNLECAISSRGRAVPKEFNFRGRPRALRKIVRFAGLDVLNLANNHTGDFGTAALRDTLRHVKASGALPVGAGANLERAQEPRVVERLGLRVAFVGFSDINPWGFLAGPSTPGISPATPEAIRAGVRAARRRADVVVATFHWGVERAPRENARQRAFAGEALRAGASAVIGAHPHVPQPIRARGRKVVAYSLGNFVWAAGSPQSAATGILRLRLSARGVEAHRLQRATIVNTRPVLRRGGA
ncbi:MAG TPA: CapA family protein [Capillimicrobium sp.]|jgi:poly-gamma-glutamate capsule biosynthesis protein CapA/YwtB (metallophosphatase superfamily)